MQSVSFRIWTRVAVSISYDDNHGYLLRFLNLYQQTLLLHDRTFLYNDFFKKYIMSFLYLFC